MADTNWIKLNRKIWDSFIWSFDEPKYSLAWVDMLLMANYKDKQIMFNGKVETIQRGSFITSMLKLAERWDMNRKTVKSFLDILQQNGMITYTTTKRRTTVYITNYLIYQGFAGFDDSDDGQQNGQQNGQPDGQQNGQQNGQPDGHNIRRLKKIQEGEEGKEGKESYKGDSSAGKRPSPPPSVPYEDIKNLYNEICKSFPRCTAMSEARKKAVKARMSSGYTLEHFKAVFTKAEASTFLKGGNDRNWKASFDWLIKDANMAKVLDGNYDDMKGGNANGNAPNNGNTGSAPRRYGNYV